MKEQSERFTGTSSIVTTAWVVLLAGLLTVVGCTPGLDAAGRAKLARARRTLDSGQFSRGVETLSSLLDEYSETTEAGEVFYLRGLCYRRQNPADDDAAITDFEEAARISPDAHVRGLALVALGHTLFEKDTASKQLQAIAHYKKALRDLPDEPPRDAVLYRLGVASQNVGQWQAADSYFSQCFGEFEDSTFAARARQRFGARAFRLQVGAFSELDNALRKVAFLRKAGWQSDWVGEMNDRRLLYVVRTGHYTTYEDAKPELIRLQQIVRNATIVTADQAQHHD